MQKNEKRRERSLLFFVSLFVFCVEANHHGDNTCVVDLSGPYRALSFILRISKSQIFFWISFGPWRIDSST
jgi:hypothetical protein